MPSALDVFRRFERQAIDFTKRNRLLNYPKTAASVGLKLQFEELIAEYSSSDPEDLIIKFPHNDILRLEKLKHAREGEEDEKNKAILEKEISNLEKALPPCSLEGEKLIKLLEKFRLDSKRKFEEHGLHTLFLAIGAVRWKEKLAGRGSSKVVKESDYEAPIVLIPVTLKMQKHPSKQTVLEIDTSQYDIRVNPVLLLLLEQEYSAQKIDPPEEAEEIIKKYPALCKEITKSFKSVNMECEIEDGVWLRMFSFHGQQIYEDLKRNEQQMVGQEFIQALCEGKALPTSKQDMLSAGIDDELDGDDQELGSETDTTVLDADSSQLSVLKRAKTGEHLLVTGPPGTGKSQTVVNSIAGLIASGKSVLVLSEKQAALKVVYDRIRGVGLHTMCLPLYEHATDKKKFASSLIEDARSIVYRRESDPSWPSTILKSREKRMKHLTGYAQALLRYREPLGRHVYWVHGELSKAHSVTKKNIAWIPENVATITHEEYMSACEMLRHFADVLEIHQTLKENPWNCVRRTSFSPDFSSRVQDALDRIVLQSQLAWKQVQDAKKELPPYLKLISISDLKQLREIVETLAKPKALKSLQGASLHADRVKDILAKCAQIRRIAARYEEMTKKTGMRFTVPKGWEQPDFENVDMLHSEASLHEFSKAAETASQIHALAMEIGKALESLRRETKQNILLEPFEKFRQLEVLFRNHNELRLVQDLNSVPTLLERLRDLRTLDEQVSEQEKFLERHGILLDNLLKTDVRELEQKFRSTYTSWLKRQFSSTYKKDVAVVLTWCSVHLPGKHHEVQQLVLTLSEWQRCSALLEKRMETLSAELLTRPLHRREITSLYSVLSGIEGKLANIPKGDLQIYKNAIDKTEKMDLLEQLAQSLVHLEQTSLPIASIVTEAMQQHLPALNTKLYLEFLLRLSKQIMSIHELMPRVRAGAGDGGDGALLAELQRRAGAIHEVSEMVREIENVGLQEDLKGVADDPIQLLLKPEVICRIESLLEQILRLFPSLPSISAEDFEAQIDSLSSLVSAIAPHLDHVAESEADLSRLFENERSIETLEQSPIADFLKTLEAMRDDSQGLERWTRYQRLSSQLKETGFKGLLDEIAQKPLEPPELVACYSKVLWNRWLEAIYRDDKHLTNFDYKKHTGYIKEFRELEEQSLKANALRLLKQRREPMATAMKHFLNSSNLLVRESQKKKRHLPPRKLIENAGDLIKFLKPCWLMSPLTLSSFLPFGTVKFDVVIFDESSQIRVQHALGAIGRSTQVIVMGDPNQLPPTSFFDAATEEEEDEEEATGNRSSDRTDFESLIHAAATVLPNSQTMLCYHYRSRFEKLIAFSNHYIYDDRLVTFPSPSSKDTSVELVYVPNGNYDRGGTRRNDIEAAKVAEMCIEHVRKKSGKSLGVIALSKAQEVAIRDALMDKLKESPECAEYLDENSTDLKGFFIKNLESVQGDERDVIMLSVGYGKDKQGNMYQNFGPINSDGGHRRLNVAITRACDKVFCVSSIKATDIVPSHARGTYLLQKYLEYAEKGIETLAASKIAGTEIAGEDSPFETEVKRALENRGYSVQSQVGVSGFKVDLAILHPDQPSMYLLGVECDGATYHSTKSARERDRLRQEILERLGWTLYRVWSQHWLLAREEIIDDIVKTVDGLRYKKVF